jgi:transcriptional regulator with XRE-family HTH domain
MHMSEIISVLKQRRKVLKVTQEEVADLSDVAFRTMKAIEAGKGNPTFSTLLKILEVLGMEVVIQVKKS